jgi:hypothetical protein
VRVCRVCVCVTVARRRGGRDVDKVGERLPFALLRRLLFAHSQNVADVGGCCVHCLSVHTGYLQLPQHSNRSQQYTMTPTY